MVLIADPEGRLESNLSLSDAPQALEDSSLAVVFIGLGGNLCQELFYFLVTSDKDIVAEEWDDKVAL